MTRERDGTIPEPDWVVDIRPEPSADELDAVIAALAVWREQTEDQSDAVPSRWAMAGRFAAQAGLSPRERYGRGRGVPRRGG